MWLRLNEHVGRYWDAFRHENKFGLGVPDVSYGAKNINGWMELKCLDTWPVRFDTIVQIPHYTPQQKVWLWRRGQYGGHTWLLLNVAEEWLLFNHIIAQRVGKDLTKRGLAMFCDRYWIGLPSIPEFIDAITGPGYPHESPK